MKAARLYGPGDLRVEELPEPGAPGPGEVLLEVEAVGVCGSDLHYYTHGGIGDKVLEAPLVLGHEPAGVVVAVGDGVGHVRRGDRVAIDPAVPCGICEWCIAGHPNLCPQVRFFGTPPVDGALQELVVHPADCVHPLPESMSFAEGALCETLGVALHAVDLAHLRPGESVAVLGCGPVGLLCLQVAKCAGAWPLVVADLVPERLEVARSLGADLTVDASREHVVAAMLDYTRGRGVDAAFDAATSNETPQQCCEATTLGGCVVLCGIPPDDSFTLSHSVARRRGLTLRFARRMKHAYGRAIGLAQRGAVELDLLATHYFPLADAALAFQAAVARRDGLLKAVIEL